MCCTFLQIPSRVFFPCKHRDAGLERICTSVYLCPVFHGTCPCAIQQLHYALHDRTQRVQGGSQLCYVQRSTARYLPPVDPKYSHQQLEYEQLGGHLRPVRPNIGRKTAAYFAGRGCVGMHNLIHDDSEAAGDSRKTHPDHALHLRAKTALYLQAKSILVCAH